MIAYDAPSLIKRFFVAFISICLFPNVILAQSPLEEIIVTAQKREQNLNDVGLSVTAFGGDDIKELGIFQPEDLANHTPNLNINNAFGNSIPNISIRGLGLNDYALNNNPAVGMYTDEVYLVSPGMLSFQVFDMERVEVLKGPQGTLFGRNTTAGAINFISKKPSKDTSGYISAGYGRFKRVDLEGAVGGAISSNVSGRIAVQTTRQNNGHQFNRATAQDVGAIDRTSWRSLLNWQASDKFNLLLNVHEGKDRSDTYLLKLDNLLTPADDEFFPGGPFNSAGRPDTFVDINSIGGSLAADWNISDQLSLKSITAIENYSRTHVEDRDGTVRQDLDGEFRNKIKQFSQEIRLSYTKSNFLVIGGIFYGKDNIKTRDNFVAVDLIGAIGFFSIGNEYQQDTNSLSAFTHSELALGNDFNLTVGVRYINEKKNFNNAFTFFTPAANGEQTSTDEAMIFPPVNNERKFNDFSGKIGLDYRGNDDVLLYVSVSKGFKSGGFQGQLTFNPDDLNGFGQEEVLAYEMGFKGQLLNHRMQLNGSAFYYDYTDFQLYGSLFEGPPGVGPLFGIRNIGDARIYGLEIDMLWGLTEELEVRLGLGFLNTKIISNNNPDVQVNTGSNLPNSPPINFNASIKYEKIISAGYRAGLTLSANYKDKTSYDIVRQPLAAIEKGYWLVDLRAGINAISSGWTGHIWAKNLTNQQYRSQVLITSVGPGETYGLPRTYGVTLGYKF